MRRVYSSGNSAVFGRKQKVYNRRLTSADLSRRFAKMMGGVIGAITVLTVLGVFFMGQTINSRQSELEREAKIHSDLKQANELLLAERNSMLREERIAMSAAKLGLFPSPGNQVRRAL